MPSVSGIVYDTAGAPVGAGRVVRVYRRDTGALLGSVTTSAGPAADGDEHFSLTALALIFNGIDGATSATDVSAVPKVITFHGNAQLDTAFQYSGAASLLVDGTGDFVSVANNTVLDFGSGDFTIGMWLRPATTTGFANLVGKRIAGNYGPFSLALDSGRVRARCSKANTTWDVDLTGTIVLSTSAFTYCEVVRDTAAGLIRLHVGGVPDGTAALTGALMTNTAPVYIGANSLGTDAFSGHMDDIVLWKGVAKHTGDYSTDLPPAYIAAQKVLPSGGYLLSYAGYAGEVNVVALDNVDIGGSPENDLILRTLGV